MHIYTAVSRNIKHRLRQYLTESRDFPPKRLAAEDSRLARAVTQAKLMRTLLPLLTEEEADAIQKLIDEARREG